MQIKHRDKISEYSDPTWQSANKYSRTGESEACCDSTQSKMRRPSVPSKAMIVKPTPSRLQLYHQALGLMALFRNSEKLALLRLIFIKVNNRIVKTLGRANRANHAQHLLCDPRSQSAGSENTFWWPTSVLKHSQPVKILQKFKQNGPSLSWFSSFLCPSAPIIGVC